MSAVPPLIAGVELGGTKCVCILASGPQDIRDEHRIATGAPAETLAGIASILAEWQDKHGFAAIGIGGFGPIDLDPGSPDYGRVTATPKPGWRGTDLLAPMKAFGMAVAIDTDVSGAALAEGRWGAARGLASFAYVTIGTGVGAGLIVEGQPVRGLGHSEAGHMRVPQRAGHDWPGICPYHGDCVEGLVSGPAIAARVGTTEGGPPREDAPIWEDVAFVLAGMFHNLVLTTVPQRIIVGGGVAAGQPHLLPRVRRAMRESLAGYAAAGAIEDELDAYLVPPALGERAGPLGAIAIGLGALAAGGNPAVAR